MSRAPMYQSLLRYRLAPDAVARQALETTFQAYGDMMNVLAEVAPPKGGANLVTLHELAYETVRNRTALPSRLVTLGLRDFASSKDGHVDVSRLPFDDKLFAIKGPSDLTIATVKGRVAVPFDVLGYSKGWGSVFPAYLTRNGNHYEIHIGVNRNTDIREEGIMNEGILSRMGRLIAGIAHATVDKAEGINKIAVIEQAIREIDTAADEARTDIGKARAEEHRIVSRRNEILSDLTDLDEKISLAVSAGRDDLAKAGVARQIDLESQTAALDKALADTQLLINEGQKALQAVLATRREASARLADFKRSIAQTPDAAEKDGRTTPATGAARAAAAVARVTGVPGGETPANLELDELDRLHREQAIEARLARFKANRS